MLLSSRCWTRGGDPVVHRKDVVFALPIENPVRENASPEPARPLPPTKQSCHNCEVSYKTPRHSRVGGNPFVALYRDNLWRMDSRFRGNDERLDWRTLPLLIHRIEEIFIGL
jgi:hypothetical protein